MLGGCAGSRGPHMQAAERNGRQAGSSTTLCPDCLVVLGSRHSGGKKREARRAGKLTGNPLWVERVGGWSMGKVLLNAQA